MVQLMKKLTIPILVACVFFGCNKKTVPSATAEKDVQPATEQVAPSRDYAGEGFTKATVIDMTGLDGCDHLLKLETGKKLQPTNLNLEYKQDKLQVWIKYSVPKGLVGICMSGTIVRLSAIEKRN